MNMSKIFKYSVNSPFSFCLKLTVTRLGMRLDSGWALGKTGPKWKSSKLGLCKGEIQPLRTSISELWRPCHHPSVFAIQADMPNNLHEATAFFELELIPGQFVVSTWSESQQDTLEPVLATLHPPFPLLWVPTGCCQQRFLHLQRSAGSPLGKGEQLCHMSFLVLGPDLLIPCLAEYSKMTGCTAKWVEWVCPILSKTLHFQEVPIRITLFTNLQ